MNLLAAKAPQVATAKLFVEKVKEDFPVRIVSIATTLELSFICSMRLSQPRPQDLVKKCFITDCPPSKGYEKTDAGATRNHVLHRTPTNLVNKLIRLCGRSEVQLLRRGRDVEWTH